MKEIQDIIQAFDRAQEEGRRTALATVVHVEGSSYRRPGARMLIQEDGQLTGAISGGCFEGDALRKALLAMQEGKAKLVTYDTTDEDDSKLGVQLGCNGIIHILIEPINEANPQNPVQLLKKLAEKRQQGVIVTLFSFKRLEHQLGTCLLLLNHETIAGQIDESSLQEVIVQDARAALVHQTSSVKTYVTAENNITAFIEFVKPVIAIVIVGAGNDAMPLVDLAAVLGWHISIVDGRPNHATPSRFKKAHKVIVAKPEAVLSQVALDEQTVFVLMTHNYNYDKALLRQLVMQPINYIGLLGPKKKLELMLKELEQEETFFNDDQLSRIYGPVGLDLGAETAEEIALSIVAEIKAVLSRRTGKFLRNKEETIHNHSLEKISYTTVSTNR